MLGGKIWLLFRYLGGFWLRNSFAFLILATAIFYRIKKGKQTKSKPKSKPVAPNQLSSSEFITRSEQLKSPG